MNKTRPAVLIVDNYDSFTFNLVQLVRESGDFIIDIVKNDRIYIPGSGKYDGFLFSPGPGIPGEFPAMQELLRIYGMNKSFLGICLGHQAIAEFFGLNLVRLDDVRHGVGTVVRITDPSDYIFHGMQAEFRAGLYHSWAVGNSPELSCGESELRITALDNEGVIMALSHREYDIKGVQFHPESWISPESGAIVRNWLAYLTARVNHVCQ
ncbi:MAG: aminodeoxychorismate/anthranilate synthase component II [Bacteroidales bacterium]|jgi:anthranilate synthase component 2|nr:aminodeoxychorismate/anthranilate synthase component II [Bacteroidales bacterium]MCU0408384.1 aminodeoxychorismate/anthranilate synthase component II [Bacteroidales bacterium]